MSDEFRVGDRVRVTVEKWGTKWFGREGTILETPPKGYGTRYYARVDFDGRPGLVHRSEIEPVEAKFVHVQEQKTVWVTLPGDTAGHKLSNDDALTLLRQLEDALA